MLHTFLITVAIVSGILSPVIVILFFIALINGFRSAKEALILKTVEAKMQPPFSAVEVSPRFEDGSMTVKFLKGDEVVWQGNIPRKVLEG